MSCLTSTFLVKKVTLFHQKVTNKWPFSYSGSQHDLSYSYSYSYSYSLRPMGLRGTPGARPPGKKYLIFFDPKRYFVGQKVTFLVKKWPFFTTYGGGGRVVDYLSHPRPPTAATNGTTSLNTPCRSSASYICIQLGLLYILHRTSSCQEEFEHGAGKHAQPRFINAPREFNNPFRRPPSLWYIYIYMHCCAATQETVFAVWHVGFV